MNKKHFLLPVLASLFGLIFFYTIKDTAFVRQRLDAYAQSIAEEQFGAKLLSQVHQEKIMAIAHEMNMSEPIVIRKMNHKAYSVFGYHNAFVYFPQFLGCIPIGNKPFLFVSEGFLEDLSQEEQRFLIGHELIHAREHHAQYLVLLLYMGFIVMAVLWWIVTQYILTFFTGYSAGSQQFIWALSGLILFPCFLRVPTVASFAYRRHIEWEADQASLGMLQSHDGGIKLIERWQKEFNLPLHNPYWGLFADHPSCYERKVYCMNTQNKTKDTL